MIRKTLFWTFVSIVYAFVTWTGLFAISLPGDIVLSRSTPDPMATCFQALHGRGVGFPLVAYSESGRNSCDSTKALNVFAVIIDLAIFILFIFLINRSFSKIKKSQMSSFGQN